MSRISEAKKSANIKAWHAMYNEFLGSGKTVSAWCKEQDLSIKTFYYRLRRIRESVLGKQEIVPMTEVAKNVPTVKTEDNEQQIIRIKTMQVTVELPKEISPYIVVALVRGINLC